MRTRRLYRSSIELRSPGDDAKIASRVEAFVESIRQVRIKRTKAKGMVGNGNPSPDRLSKENPVCLKTIVINLDGPYCNNYDNTRNQNKKWNSIVGINCVANRGKGYHRTPPIGPPKEGPLAGRSRLKAKDRWNLHRGYQSEARQLFPKCHFFLSGEAGVSSNASSNRTMFTRVMLHKLRSQISLYK